MSRGEELAKNTMILLIGRISTRAIGFLLLPLYTAYLSEVQYGVVDLVSTLITLLCPIVGLQLDQAVFRYMVTRRDDRKELRRIISSAIFSEAVLIAGYVLIFIIASRWINNDYKWFLLTNVIIATLFGFANQVLRGLGRNSDYAVAAFIASVCTISLNILFIVGLDWGAFGMLAAIFIGNLVAIGYCVIRGKFWQFISIREFDVPLLKEMVSYSVPLIPNELSWWAIRASDRLVISAFLGLAATGVISVGHKFPEIFMTVYSVFGLAWTESIVLHYKEKDGLDYFSRNVNTMMKFFSSVNLLILAAVPFVFGLLVNVKFDESYKVIPLYFISSIINVVIGLISVIYVANHETKVIAKTSMLGAIVSIISDIILAQFVGIYASPLSLILGFGTMLIYRAIDMRRLARVDWDYRFVCLFVVGYAIVSACFYSGSYYVRAIGLISAVAFSCYFNQENIIALKAMLLRRLKRSSQ